MDGHGPQDEAASPFGLIADPRSPEPLYVRTGLPDDARQPLRRSQVLYRFGLLAWHWQDRWTDEFHRDFWTALVHRWPRPSGKRGLAETRGWWAHRLRAGGFSDHEIADILCLDADSLRRVDAFMVGETVWQEQIEGPVELYGAGRAPRPLPRVYALGEHEPPYTWVNLPLGTYMSPEAIALENHVRKTLRARDRRCHS